MDPRLLHLYNLELQYLREMGAEFAEEFPKIAGRLGMKGLEVADPYVERLLEGAGFLAARVQLKLEAQFPRFTQALLELVHPHYLAPTPPMLIAQATPDPGEASLASGTRKIPRGSTLSAAPAGGDETACEFRTAHDVTLWPVEIVSASYFTFAPDLPLNTFPIAPRIKGGIRLRLKTTAGLTFAQTAIDRLAFYVSGRDDVANRIHELVLGSALGVIVHSPGRLPRSYEFLPSSEVRAPGFADEEALLPVSNRSFQGYRLLQEYFAFPQRYRFFELTGLAQAIARAAATDIEIVLPLARGEPALESVLDASNFALFCTPAINLFPRRAGRIHVRPDTFEYHVVVDRTRPMDYEVYDVTAVVGHGLGAANDQEFLPFYASYAGDDRGRHTRYFTTRREPRLISTAQKRRGGRSSYVGSEVFLALVDAEQAPFSGDLRELSVQTTCTNRDLVLQMPIGGGTSDFTLDISVPVTGLRVVSGPSRPYSPVADAAVSWHAISHLAQNYYSLIDATPQEGAAALRGLLALYVAGVDPAARKQIDGVRSVAVRPVVRRLHEPGPLAFGRGLEITVGVDDMAFEGGSAFLLGSVLHRYFTRHVTINSFVETVLRSEARGEITRWQPHRGARPTL